MKIKAISLFFLLIMLCNSAGGFQLKGKIIKKSFVSSVTNSERDYLLYLPADIKPGDKLPVMLFLHGNGERGNDVELVKIHGPLKEVEKGRDFPFIIIAPQMLPFPEGFEPKHSKGNWSTSGRTEMKRETFEAEFRYPDEPYLPYGWKMLEDDLIYLINETVKNYSGDTNRIYITGLSYGGYGTWYMLSKYPELFAAGVPVCGAGDPEDVKTIGKTPVWLFQGGRDRVVLPQWSLKMADELEKSGGNVRVTVHEDLAHDCWTRVYSGHDVYDWLLKNTKR